MIKRYWMKTVVDEYTGHEEAFLEESELGSLLKYDDVKQVLETIRQAVWYEDIESPTVPEYIELHEKIQRILKVIDNYLEVEK